MINKRTQYFILAIFFFVAAILLWVRAVQPLSAKDECAPYAWMGQPFDYRVDAQGNWNYPPDTQRLGELTFHDALVEKYFSEAQNQSYILVLLDLEPTQPEGARLGQHDLCSYTFDGFGLGVN